MSECDIDDIICNFKALTSMRELKAALGNENFVREFPELESVVPRLEEKIKSSGASLREALARCGNIDLADELPFEEQVGPEDIGGSIETEEE